MYPQSVLFFACMYLISFVVVMGCDSWFLVWLGLEINMISFISLIYSRSLMNIESCMSYFFIQSMGSGMFIGSFYLDFEYLVFVMCMVLSYKIGGGIFFYWFPSLCEGISWMCCLMLMTLQKIMPFMLMSMFLSDFMWMMAFISMVAGVMGAFNEIKLKKLMAYSSVYHVGWVMVCMYLGMITWLIYFIFYFFMIWGIILIFNEGSYLEVSDVIKSNKFLIIMLGSLNMGGMPPMLGFFMKWWVFYLMVDFSMIYISLMIVLSVFMLYIYLRMVFGVFLGANEVLVSAEFMNFGYGFGKKEELYLFGVIFGPLLGLFFV